MFAKCLSTMTKLGQTLTRLGESGSTLGRISDPGGTVGQLLGNFLVTVGQLQSSPALPGETSVTPGEQLFRNLRGDQVSLPFSGSPRTAPSQSMPAEVANTGRTRWTASPPAICRASQNAMRAARQTAACMPGTETARPTPLGVSPRSIPLRPALLWRAPHSCCTANESPRVPVCDRREGAQGQGRVIPERAQVDPGSAQSPPSHPRTYGKK